MCSTELLVEFNVRKNINKILFMNINVDLINTDIISNGWPDILFPLHLSPVTFVVVLSLLASVVVGLRGGGSIVVYEEIDMY